MRKVLLSALILAINITGCSKATQLYSASIGSDNNYSTYCNEVLSKLSDEYNKKSDKSERIYIDEYVEGARNYYEDALTYKVERDKELEAEGNGISEGDSLEKVAIIGDNGEIITDSTDEIFDTSTNSEEYDAELEEIITSITSEVPDYDTTSIDDIGADLRTIEDKDTLLDYYIDKIHPIGDIGDKEPTPQELNVIYLKSIGTEDSPNNGLSMDEWNNLTLEEAKDYVIKSLVYSIKTYNDYLLSIYDYYLSDEYRDALYQAKYHHDEQISKINRSVGIIDTELEKRIADSGVSNTSQVNSVIEKGRNFNYTPIEIDENLIDTLNSLGNKYALMEYYVNNVHSYQGDFGEDELTVSEIFEVYLSSIGTENSSGITIEEWDSYTFEEAVNYIYNSLKHDADLYNQRNEELKNYYNSDEYANSIIESQKIHESQKVKEKDYPSYAEVALNHESDEATYEEFISQTDMDNPTFSDAIKQDEEGKYYIPWSVLYELAETQNNGVMMDNLEFIVYSQKVTIPMPTAPRSWYGSKGEYPTLVEWRLLESSVGRKKLEVTIKLPEEKDNRVLTFDITSDGEIKDTNKELEALLGE